MKIITNRYLSFYFSFDLLVKDGTSCRPIQTHCSDTMIKQNLF